MAVKGESDYIFGLHDIGGERLMEGVEYKCWIVKSDGIAEPSDGKTFECRPIDPKHPPTYSAWTDKGYGFIVRLNAGYARTGTIPLPQYYDEFAKCAAAWVKAAEGDARIWVIGNETNNDKEWPAGEVIEPEQYVDCFTRVRRAIKAIKGVGPKHQVVLQALSPEGSPKFPDPLKYYDCMWEELGKRGSSIDDIVDGIALHAYSPGDPSSDPSFAKFKKFLKRTPDWARGLPVYITETNMGEVGWNKDIHDWVFDAYSVVEEWNRYPANQTVRALCLYRWSAHEGDPKYGIEDKEFVQEQFKAALATNYRWKNPPYGRFFIQGSIGAVGDFEAVVAAPWRPDVTGLMHWDRSNDVPGNPWELQGRFGGGVNFSAATVQQSNWDGNLESVAIWGQNLTHFWRNQLGEWIPDRTFESSNVSGVPAFIQGRFGDRGNFEVVVPRPGPEGGIGHYYRNNNNPADPRWFSTTTFGNRKGYIYAAVALIQSHYGDLEVVARTGSTLHHYRRGRDGRWEGPIAIDIGVEVTGTPGFVQARYTEPGNFVVVIPLVEGGLARVERLNEDNKFPNGQQPWVLKEKFAQQPINMHYGAASVLQSNYGDLGNLEVLARENGTSKLHHWYYNTGPGRLGWVGPTDKFG